MQKVLWLASWYPNKYDLYNGDFIQRHAMAVVPFCGLDIITIQFVPTDWQSALIVSEHLRVNSFQEIIIYLRQSTLPFPFNKIVDQYRYTWAYKQEVKKYLSNTSPNLIHVHVPIKSGIIGLWLKRKLRIPLVVTEHWGIYNNYAPDKYVGRSFWFKALTKRIIANADTLLPVSKNLGDSINSLVTKKPFTVVYNVVDTRLFYYIPTNNSPLFWLSHVSMMNHPKNPKGLLRAFAEAVNENKQLRLRMIGQASDEIINYAHELRIDEFVIFTGMLPQKEVAQLLQQSNAFLLFSHYENMPCVIAEALCCGLPVISSHVGGISEIIDTVNGILVPASDESACTHAILELCTKHDQFNNRLIAERASAIFSYDTIGRQIIEVYEQQSLR